MKSSYFPSLKLKARELRKNGTKGEAILWKKVLKAKLMEGYQFNRQFPVDRYIVDFVCRRLNLIIEVDGNSHIAKGDYDSQRQNYLENLGYTVLRFEESEIINELQSVHYQISIVVKQIETQLEVMESLQFDNAEIPPAPL